MSSQGSAARAAVKIPKRIMKWAGSLVLLLKGGLAVFQLLSKQLLTFCFYGLKGQQSFVLQKRLDTVLWGHVLCFSVYHFGAHAVLRGQTSQKRNIKINLQGLSQCQKIKIFWVQILDLHVVLRSKFAAYNTYACFGGWGFLSIVQYPRQTTYFWRLAKT